MRDRYIRFVVSLIIDQMLESREKQQNMKKLNMVIGTFFSSFGTLLLRMLSLDDTGIKTVQYRIAIGSDWQNSQFTEVKNSSLNG